jgi:hypothetical protein
MKSETHIEERWIPLKRFNNLYSVSDLGRIKSHERVITTGRFIKEAILKPIMLSTGYYCVNLTTPIRRQYSIHRLVCEAFYGESNLFVNHKDFDKSNNRLDNLEYCTQKENILHSIIGERNGQILLDSYSGIFYNTYSDAANALTINIESLYKMMRGCKRNNTTLVKV